MAPYRGRAKVEKGKLGVVVVTQRGVVVTLSCGCTARKQPQVSNPDRWWCAEHGGWQTRKRGSA